MGLSNLLGSRWRKDKSLSAEIPVGHITPGRTQQFWPKPALLLTFLTNATKERGCARLLRHTPVLSSQRLSVWSYCTWKACSSQRVSGQVGRHFFHPFKKINSAIRAGKIRKKGNRGRATSCRCIPSRSLDVLLIAAKTTERQKNSPFSIGRLRWKSRT